MRRSSSRSAVPKTSPSISNVCCQACRSTVVASWCAGSPARRSSTASTFSTSAPTRLRARARLRAQAIERPILDRHRQQTRTRWRRGHQLHRSQSQPAIRDLADCRGPQRTQDQFRIAGSGSARRASAAGRAPLSSMVIQTDSAPVSAASGWPASVWPEGDEGLAITYIHRGRLRVRCRAGSCAADGRCQRSADRAQPDVARTVVECRSHLRIQVRAEPVDRAPASIYVITREEILRSGVLSVPEALRLAPNLQVTQLTSTTYSNGARGFAGAPDVQNFSNKILMLIDGRSVYSPLFSGIDYDMQDVLMDDIDRIEVISGPGATLWGANAMNGVINIITRKASESQWRAGAPRCGRRRTGGGAALRRRHRRAMPRSACTPSGSIAAPRNSPTARSADDDWSKWQAGFRLDGGADRHHFTVQGDYQAAEQGFAGVPRRRLQRRQSARPLGTRGRSHHHAHAGVSSIASIANARPRAWHTTSTPTISISSRAPVSERGTSWCGGWGDDTTTTRRSTTTSLSCPITARWSSPISSCRTRSRSTKN